MLVDKPVFYLSVKHFTLVVITMIFCQRAVQEECTALPFQKTLLSHTATCGKPIWISFHAHTRFSACVCMTLRACAARSCFFYLFFTRCASSTHVSQITVLCNQSNDTTAPLSQRHIVSSNYMSVSGMLWPGPLSGAGQKRKEVERVRKGEKEKRRKKRERVIS